MKPNNILQNLTVAALTASLCVPSSALAQTRLDASATVRAKPEALSVADRARVCTGLENRVRLLETRYAELQKRLEANQGAQKDRLESLRNERLDHTKTWQDKENTNRNTQFTKLEALAKTDARKAAVVEFKMTVETAVTVRREAFRAADETFKAQMRSAADNWKTSASDAAANFRAAVQTAADGALTLCKSGDDAELIRTAFQADLKTARMQFQNDRKSLTRVGDQAKAYAHSRKEAYATAFADFKITLEAARIALKAAFAADASKTVSN